MDFHVPIFAVSSSLELVVGSVDHLGAMRGRNKVRVSVAELISNLFFVFLKDSESLLTWLGAWSEAAALHSL